MCKKSGMGKIFFFMPWLFILDAGTAIITDVSDHVMSCCCMKASTAFIQLSPEGQI